MNQTPYLKLKEVQAMLGVSRSTVWRWHAERGLKVVTVGGVTRVRERDLEEFLKRHEVESVPQNAAVTVPKSDDATEAP